MSVCICVSVARVRLGGRWGSGRGLGGTGTGKVRVLDCLVCLEVRCDSCMLDGWEQDTRRSGSMKLGRRKDFDILLSLFPVRSTG